MGELFGKWVPQKWIDDVMEAVITSPQWNYLFLTKNPERYIGMKWPDNAWVGTTVDVQSRVKSAEDAFKQFNAPVKFVSCEPMLEDIVFSDIGIFDWVIIGGRSKSSGMPAEKANWGRVRAVITQAKDADCKVYLKPNAIDILTEYPEMELD